MSSSYKIRLSFLSIVMRCYFSLFLVYFFFLFIYFVILYNFSLVSFIFYSYRGVVMGQLLTCSWNHLDEVITQMLPKVVDGTVIEGGHYPLEQSKNGDVIHKINEASSATFAAAVKLFSSARDSDIHVSLSFLIADLAVEASLRQKFNDSFRLPAVYGGSLLRYRIKEEDIIFFYESTLRNRAQRFTKASLQSGDAVIKDGVCRLSVDMFGPYSDDEIANRPKDAPRRVPNCRMILAQQLKDKEELKDSNGQKLSFVKAIGFLNPDVYRCEGAFADVYRQLYKGKMDVVTVFFKPDFSVEVRQYDKR